MDLYGDLPPTKDGSEAGAGTSVIQVALSEAQKQKIEKLTALKNSGLIIYLFLSSNLKLSW